MLDIRELAVVLEAVVQLVTEGGSARAAIS